MHFKIQLHSDWQKWAEEQENKKKRKLILVAKTNFGCKMSKCWFLDLIGAKSLQGLWKTNIPIQTTPVVVDVRRFWARRWTAYETCQTGFWEGAEWNDERGVTEKEERTQSYHFRPNRAGFCSAFPRDYTHDQFDAAPEPLWRIPLSFLLFPLLLHPLDPSSPPTSFRVTTPLFFPSALLLFGTLLKGDIPTSVCLCVLERAAHSSLLNTHWGESEMQRYRATEESLSTQPRQIGTFKSKYFCEALHVWVQKSFDPSNLKRKVSVILFWNYRDSKLK